MRAHVAYISSLGTTAILVAASVMMLVVVGAIVGFRGWPGGVDGAGVQQVPLAPATTPARVALVRRGTPVRRIVRAGASRTAARPVSTVGLVKSVTVGPSVVPGLVMVPVSAAPMHPVSAHPIVPGNPLAGSPGGPAPPQGGPSPPGGPPSVPNAGGPLPVPVGTPAVPPPSSDQVMTMVGGLLASPPPPPALDTAGGAARAAGGVSGALH
jgi:hypothetical protein